MWKAGRGVKPYSVYSSDLFLKEEYSGCVKIASGVLLKKRFPGSSRLSGKLNL
jgi:hypothetical protein